MTSLVILIWISLVILVSFTINGGSKIEIIAYLIAQWVSIWAVLYEAGSLKQGRFKRFFRILTFISFIFYMLIISYSILSRKFNINPLEDIF
jgi:hypothetical protein